MWIVVFDDFVLFRWNKLIETLPTLLQLVIKYSFSPQTCDFSSVQCSTDDVALCGTHIYTNGLRDDAHSINCVLNYSKFLYNSRSLYTTHPKLLTMEYEYGKKEPLNIHNTTHTNAYINNIIYPFRLLLSSIYSNTILSYMSILYMFVYNLHNTHIMSER